MNDSLQTKNRRVLIIDDNPAIHEDFRKILPHAIAKAAAFNAEAALFGPRGAAVEQTRFEVDSAYQGLEGVQMVAQAMAAGRPYAMAFVDVRMPPGLDGVETTRKIWEIDPDVQIVICTAFSDYSWDEMFQKLGQNDGLLILKKPFDAVEALQLAYALTEKWWLSQQSRRKMEELETKVAGRTQELAKSLSLLNATLESTTDGIVAVDLAGKIVSYNIKFAVTWQFPDGMLDRRDASELRAHIAGEVKDPVAFLQRIKEVQVRSGAEAFDVVELKDGRTFERYVFPQRIEGKCVGTVSNWRDITERKRAEEEVLLKSAFLEAQVDSSLDGILVVDQAGKQSLQNQRFVDLFKVPQHIVDEEADENRLRWVTEMNKNPEQFGQRVRHLNGHPEETSRDEIELKEGTVLDRYTAPVVGKNGKYYGRIWTFRDITERKRIEEMMRTLHAQMQQWVDHTPVVLYRLKVDGDKIIPATASENVCRMLGFTVQETMSYDWWLGQLHPDDYERAVASIAETLSTGTSQTEYRLRHKNGSYRWLEDNRRLVCDAEGKPAELVGVWSDITERKKSEEALVESKRFLRSTLDALSSKVAILDDQGTIIEVNLAWNRFASENDYVGAQHGKGRNYLQVCDTASGSCSTEAGAVASGIRAVIARERDEFHREYPCHSPRQKRWFIVRVTRFDGAGPVRVVVAHENITERKRLEETLRESEQRFRFLDDLAEATRTQTDPEEIMAVTLRMLGEHLHSSRCAYADVKPDGEQFTILRDYTNGCASIAGHYQLSLFGSRAVATMQSGDTLIVRNVETELLPDEGADMFNAIGIKAIITCPLVKDGVLRAMMAVQQTIPRDWLPSEVSLVREVVARCWSTIKRRTAEESLRQSNEKFELLADHITDAFWIRSPDLKTVHYVSPAFAQIWGRSVESLYANPQEWSHFIAPEDRERVLAAFAALTDDTLKLDIEYRILRPDGEVRWIHVRGFQVRDEAGRLISHTGIVTDITERKWAEVALRASEARYRSLIENARDAIFTIALDGTFTSLNPAVETMAGISRADWIGKPFAPMVHPEDLPLAVEMFQRIVQGGHTPVHELRGNPALRRPALMEMTLAPLLNDSGKIIGLLGIGRDITERKQLELQLYQAQKMESIGKLAGGVAHEFNSIMTAIIGQSELLLENLPAGSGSSLKAAEIRDAANRAATLTRQLLAYGRKQQFQSTILDLNAVLSRVEGTLRNLLSPGVALAIIPGAGLDTVKADAAQIEQVIVNMAANADEAMPDGGKLMLETANVTLTRAGANSAPELVPGDYVMLAISDTGMGMTERIKALVFEPFFTTKGTGEGNGLGLSTCQGIIRQSGGHISVYSQPGQGSTFKIYLPKATRLSAAPITPPGSPGMPSGKETILLVEGDRELREMSTNLLRKLGYTVTVAINGIEALQLIQSRVPGTVDLLLTDLVMPQMSGGELSERVRGLYPKIQVLFTSSSSGNNLDQLDGPNKGVAVLQKPFTPSALARKLRSVLDQTSM